MKLQIYLLKQKLRNKVFSSLLFSLSPFLLFDVEEKSMMPVLAPGDSILVCKFLLIKKGDIIVIKNPQKDRKRKYLIKRVDALNSNKIYVIGENTKESIDSRQFGWVERKNVIGKMIAKV